MMNQTDALLNCTPGCKRLIQISEEEYEAKLEMGIAAIKGSYDGRIILSDKTPPEKMTLKIKAEGTAGVVDATAHLTFIEENGGTTIAYEGEGQVGGLIAGVGQRMLSGIAKLMLNQFFKGMAKEVKTVQDKVS
jgi:carbon monoxide dehydrogenase subunit G